MRTLTGALHRSTTNRDALRRVGWPATMPCYLFTYHAHGSWLPDHPRGSVKRGQGVQPANHRMAALYAQNLKQRAVNFEAAIQQLIIDAVIEACNAQDCCCHFIATDRMHVHVLTSWSSTRLWQIIRKQLRYNATQRLNKAIGRQDWFSKSPSRKQVRNLAHFDYLMQTYLPRHAGLKWCEKRGSFP